MITKKLTHPIVLLISLIVVLCGSTACGRKNYIPLTTTIKITDTITRQIPDSATLHALFECDSLGRVRMTELQNYKGLNAQQQVEFRQNELTVKTKWKTHYIERVREVHDTTIVVEVQQKERIVKKIPAFFWCCFAIALATVLSLLWRLIRR